MIFKEGFRYMKCGVIVNDLIPEDQVQNSMYDRENRPKGKTIMNALDKINLSLGKEIVRFAVQGYEKKYRLKAEWLSPRYTTNINDIIKVRI
jgi:DNA polymerase V